MKYTVRRNGHFIDTDLSRKQAIQYLDNIRGAALSVGIGVSIRGNDNDVTLTTATGVKWEAIAV